MSVELPGQTMKRPIEIRPDQTCPGQGRVAILFRNVKQGDGAAILHITPPLIQDCEYTGTKRVVAEGRQTESGFEITLGRDVVSKLQPGFSLRLRLEGSSVDEEFLWLGDDPQPKQFMHNVAHPAQRNQDLLSEQLRLFEMAKVVSTPALLSETVQDKLGLGEGPTSNTPRKMKLLANVAIALAAFIAGAAVSSLIRFSDWKLAQAEQPPQINSGLEIPKETVRPEPGTVANNSSLEPSMLRADLAASRDVPYLMNEPANRAASNGLSLQSAAPMMERDQPLPVSLARYTPDARDPLVQPPTPPQKPKLWKHAEKKGHKPLAMPPHRQRQEPQSASLFSQVSDYFARILHN